MPIPVHCPFCDWKAELADEYAGRKGRCPQCRAILAVPLRQSDPPATTPPPLPGEQELAFLQDNSATPSQPVTISQRANSTLGGNAASRISLQTIIRVGTSLAMLIAGGMIYWATTIANAPVSKPPLNAKVPTAATPRPAQPSVPMATSANVVLSDVFGSAKPGIVEIKTFDKTGREVGLGSGFVLDETGLIVTNCHVLATAYAAKAQFSNGELIDIVGYSALEPRWDLVIVKLASLPKSLKALPLATDDPPQAAEVVAVGSPLGVPIVPSKGIVRRILHTYEMDESARAFIAVLGGPTEQLWIEHDARIAPGNSGGPLLDLAGRVIGVNTWVDPASGVGYAISAKYVLQLGKKLLPKVAPLTEFRHDKDLYSLAHHFGKEDSPDEQVSPDNLQKLFDASAARHWRVRDRGDYAEMQQLARSLLVAKTGEGRGSLREAAKYADGLLEHLATMSWDAETQIKPINQAARGILGQKGVSVFCFGEVLSTTHFDQGDLTLLRLVGNSEIIAVPPNATGTTWKPGQKCVVLGVTFGQLQTTDGESICYLPLRIITSMDRKK
jgi:S1-C subfamily serine protease